VAALDAMSDEGILENATTIGRDVLGPGLRALAEKHEVIGEVRGVGVFWALDLVEDRDTRQPLGPSAIGAIKAGLLQRGMLPFSADNRIHVVPPCVITRDEAERGLAILDEALGSL
jgi:taurine--2-oxoglutarate transaminase